MSTGTEVRTVGYPGRTRRARWPGVLLGGAALMGAAGLYLGWRMTGVPANLDTATRQLTGRGLYRVVYEPRGGAVPVGRLHSWTVRVTTPDGQPVNDASLHVDGDMPQHGHGLPTAPKVSKAGGAGEYRVDGVKFQMNGWWVMDLTVRAGAGEDRAHFNLLLK